MKSKDSIFNRTLIGWFVFFLAAIPVAAQAKLQTTVVDGQYDEWDLDRDCFPPMRHRFENRTEGLSNVYLRYDSNTNTVFVLVLQADGAQRLPAEPMVKMYSAGQNSPVGCDTGDNGITPNFSWVMDGEIRIGWEGSFRLDSGAYDCAAEFHVHHNLMERASTGRQKKASEVKVLDTDHLFPGCD